VTIQAATERAAGQLVAAGTPADEARRDATILARHVLGWTLAEWIARRRNLAPAEFDDRLSALTIRRAHHEPLAYITGTREFYGRDFRVDRRVLIPRPETEGLIEEIAGPSGPSGPLGPGQAVIVDVGTGSGCVAITLSLELATGVRVVATDVSEDALAVARANAARLGATGVEFVRASLIPPGLEHVDVVVSNPPYVEERDRASLPMEVREFEPAAALFGGLDGLRVIRDLVAAAPRALRPGGRLIVEIGQGQAEAVTACVNDAGLELIAIRPDLRGIPRIVVARRPRSDS
jgi:release factor glutamine methyltransferase